jgi:hypothetical protein
MPEHSLKLANGIEVLRRARVASDGGGEIGHHGGCQIRKLTSMRNPNLGRHLEPNDPRHRAVDSPPRGDPRIPRVPLESLLAEAEERRARA